MPPSGPPSRPESADRVSHPSRNDQGSIPAIADEVRRTFDQTLPSPRFPPKQHPCDSPQYRLDRPRTSNPPPLSLFDTPPLLVAESLVLIGNIRQGKRRALYSERCVNSVNNHPRNRVSVSDCCCAAAKRQGGGFGWGVRRYGLPDNIWPSWFGDSAFQSDNRLGGLVYGDLDLAFDCGDAECRSGSTSGSEASSRNEFGTGPAPTGTGQEVTTQLPYTPAEVAELADALA